MAIVNSKLYVANSGGYTPNDYDRTVSVIDLATFEEITKIDVGINLHHLKADEYGDIYVNSRGDHYGQGSKLYVIDTQTDKVKKMIDVSASNFCIAGDTIYVYGSDFDYLTEETTISYHLVDVKTQTVLPGSFIADRTDALIKTPYGIAVDPVSRDVYVTDAKTYTNSGALFCFDKYGKKKEGFPFRTGYTPAHIAFVLK
jgi:DNA-binding beta-propeller fold protein YncE